MVYLLYTVASKSMCRESAKNIFRLIQNRDIDTRRLKGVVFDYACGYVCAIYFLDMQLVSCNLSLGLIGQN